MKTYRQQGLRNRDARRARIDKVNEHLAKMREANSDKETDHGFSRDETTGRCIVCGRREASHAR